jgi:hypothetical protein
MKTAIDMYILLVTFKFKIVQNFQTLSRKALYFELMNENKKFEIYNTEKGVRSTQMLAQIYKTGTAT